MAVVITSTTSSQAELNHGTSDSWRDAAALDEFKAAEAGAPVEEAKPEAEAKQADAEQPDAAKPEQEPPKKEHRKPSAKEQARFDKLTKEKFDYEAKWKAEATEKERERAEKEELKRQLAIARGEVPAEIPENEPVWEEYQSQGKPHNEFLRDHYAYTDKQRTRAQRVESFNKAMEEAEKEYPDWKETAEAANKTGIQLSDKVQKAIWDAIEEGDNPRAIVYYIWKHEAEARKLASATPGQAAKIVGRIAERVAAKAEAPAPAPRPKVVPPPPIEPVTNAASQGNISLDKLPPAEYIRVMNKRDLDRRRGR